MTYVQRIPALIGSLALLATNATGQVPKAFVDSAYHVAASLIGQRLAARALTPAPLLSAYDTVSRGCPSCNETRVLVAFTFRPARDTAIVGLVVVPLDTLGRPLPNLPVFGAPHCAADPARCHFISADSAMRVARAYGLPAGLHPWRVRFGWANSYYGGDWNCPHCSAYSVEGCSPLYGWQVETITSIGPFHLAGPLQNGSYLVVDATTGAVLTRGEFQRE